MENVQEFGVTVSEETNDVEIKWLADGKRYGLRVPLMRLNMLECPEGEPMVRFNEIGDLVFSLGYTGTTNTTEGVSID